MSPNYYTQLGNIQITHLLGATHHEVGTSPDKVLAKLESQGKRPYWIPSGASTHPLGGLGFARFAFEVIAQEAELGKFFSTIIVACASGSTLGGMVAGFKLAGKQGIGSNMRRCVIGIDCHAGEPGTSAANILQIARTTAVKIGLQQSDISEDDIIVDERWNAGTYGKVDQATEKAVKLLARTEAILTDPVYTGKALAGLIGKAVNGEFSDGGHVLFVHTGGVQVLSAYPEVV